VRLKSIPVEFPTLFSPGSSDENSLFHMSFYNTGHELKSMKIYDRWGGEMFSQDVIENNEISWDGKFKGKIVSPGVYIFVMETIVEGDRKKVYTGDVTVIR
jgi:gliding motility-associated-like protein